MGFNERDHFRMTEVRRIATAFLFVVPSLIVAPAPSRAQTADEIKALKAEILALRKGQEAIQRDLMIIKGLLQRQARAGQEAPAFQPTEFDLAGAPTLGSEKAAVVLVEFTDYQCPYCRRYNLQTKPHIVKDYVEPGKVRYVVREFPIQGIHPLAFKAAEATLCAGDQGKYWEMGARLFQSPERLRPENLEAQADVLGLDTAQFRTCLESGVTTERVNRDLKDGRAAGIRGTPTFFLGLADPANPDRVTASQKLVGAKSYNEFKRAIDELLAEAAKGT